MDNRKHIKIDEGAPELRKPDLEDLWNDADDARDWWLENKRQDVAITLTGMLDERQITFADLGRRLNWKRSRVSRALSGRENLTLNTIAEIVRAADLDFDLLVRFRGASRALQPWERSSMDNAALSQAETLLEYAEDLCAKTKAMHSTAETIVKRAFRDDRSKETKRFALSTLVSGDNGHEELLEAA